MVAFCNCIKKKNPWYDSVKVFEWRHFGWVSMPALKLVSFTVPHKEDDMNIKIKD